MNIDYDNMGEEEHKLNTNVHESRCSKYHEELMPNFIDVITKNITKRIKELLYIINENKYLVNYNKTFDFDVDEFTQNAMSFIRPLIIESTIVQLNSCKKIPSNKKEYKKVARNRLNRNKPKFVGNYIFEPIIFDRLYTFCNDTFGSNAMIIFISLFQDILSPRSVVRFDQTRAQPLIPYNTFVMDNKFRNSCIALLRHYKLLVEWENGNKYLNKKRETAKDKKERLATICLPKLAKLIESDEKHKQRIPNNFSYMNNVQFTTTVSMTPNNNYNINNSNDEYKSICTQNRINNTFVDCNQNQHTYNNHMLQHQHFCSESYTTPLPPIPPMNNSMNDINIDYNTHNVNNAITNANNDCNYIFDNNNSNFNTCCSNDNDNNNFLTNDFNTINNVINNNNNNNGYDNFSIYNEYDLELQDNLIIETDFNMNDINQSPMDSSIYTNSTEHTQYDYSNIIL